MSVVVNELLILVRSNVRQAVAGLEQVEYKVGTLNKVAAGLTGVGASLTTYVTAPILGLGAASVRSFAELDKAMTESLAIVEDASPQIREAMMDQARALSRELPLAAAELAEGYYFLASAGLDAAQSMDAMPSIAKFAVAGMMDMEEATELAMDSQSALGMRSKDAAENLANLTTVTDVFTQASVLSMATTDQFGSAMTNRLGAALRTVGKDIYEGTAALATLADQGIKGKAAGQALYIVLRDLQSASIKNEGAWEDMGIAVYDAEGNMRNMADILGDLEDGFAGLTDKEKKLALADLGFQDRSQGFILTMLGRSDAMKEYEAALRANDGYVSSVTLRQMESFSNQMLILKNRIIDVGISIGSALAPHLLTLSDEISPLIDDFARWIDENGELALKIGGTVAAVGPVLLILGRVAAAISFLTTPVGLAIAAIGGLVALMADMGITFDDVKTIAMDVWETIQGYFEDTGIDAEDLRDKFEEVKDRIQEIWQTLTDWFNENKTELQGIFNHIGVVLSTVWNDIWAWLEPFIVELTGFIEEEFGEMIEWFQENWPLIQETIHTILGWVYRYWKAVWPNIQLILSGVWDVIKGVVSGGMKMIRAVIQFIMAIITGNWSSAWDAIKDYFSGFWEATKGILFGAAKIIIGLIGNLMALIKLYWNIGWELIRDNLIGIWTTIKDTVYSRVNEILGFIENMVNGAIGAINTLIDGINKIPGIDLGHLNDIRIERVGPGFDVGSGGGSGWDEGGAGRAQQINNQINVNVNTNAGADQIASAIDFELRTGGY